jgi:hypothetical protein
MNFGQSVNANHSIEFPINAMASSLGRRDWPTVQAHVFAPANPHPQWLALLPIQPTDALAIHRPALASQQHRDSLVAKPRLGMRQITNPQSQRALIPRRTPAIPRRPRELRELI